MTSEVPNPGLTTNSQLNHLVKDAQAIGMELKGLASFASHTKKKTMNLHPLFAQGAWKSSHTPKRGEDGFTQRDNVDLEHSESFQCCYFPGSSICHPSMIIYDRTEYFYSIWLINVDPLQFLGTPSTNRFVPAPDAKMRVAPAVPRRRLVLPQKSVLDHLQSLWDMMKMEKSQDFFIDLSLVPLDFSRISSRFQENQPWI